MSILMAASFAFTGCTTKDNPVPDVPETPPASSMAVQVVYPVSLSEVDVIYYIGSVVTTKGNVYPDALTALEAKEVPVAMIAYVGNHIEGAHGLAIALKDQDMELKSYEDAVKACGPDKNEKIPVVGGTWRLTTSHDWQLMLIGTDDDANRYENMCAKLIAASNVPLTIESIDEDGYYGYWTSSPYHDDDSIMFVVRFIDDNSVLYNIAKLKDDPKFYCRACLVF